MKKTWKYDEVRNQAESLMKQYTVAAHENDTFVDAIVELGVVFGAYLMFVGLTRGSSEKEEVASLYELVGPLGKKYLQNRLERHGIDTLMMQMHLEWFQESLKGHELDQERDKQRADKLTHEEVERLRKNKLETNAYFQKVFASKNPEGALTCRKRHSAKKIG